MTGRPAREHPVEPPVTWWHFPDPETWGERDDLVAVGADLEPGTLLAAYRRGLFPMPIEDRLGWFSPRARGVIPLDGLHRSRSLRASVRRLGVSVDRAFDDVVAGCGDPARPDGWITPEVATAYAALHRLGWAHSVEVWSDPAGPDAPGAELVGGLYGVGIGGLFAGESMFHRATDASKVALVHLVDRLAAGSGPRLLDVQWSTPHLASLGCVEIPREEYLARLAEALEGPEPDWGS